MSKKQQPEPPKDYAVNGWRHTGEYRLRPMFLWCVCEELWESESGEKKWKRIRWPIALQRGV